MNKKIFLKLFINNVYTSVKLFLRAILIVFSYMIIPALIAYWFNSKAGEALASLIFLIECYLTIVFLVSIEEYKFAKFNRDI